MIAKVSSTSAMASVPCRRKAPPFLLLLGVVAAVCGASWAFARRPSLLRPSPSSRGNSLTPQQLTGRLKAAETSNHLLFLVEQYENVLNEYHVRAALTRLAQSNETTTLSDSGDGRRFLANPPKGNHWKSPNSMDVLNCFSGNKHV
eukprot:s1557_g10.t1